MATNVREVDVLVVGGGLAGLAAATRLGQAGRRVTLIEKAGAPGGRAATQERAGFRMNLGPHALYRAGAGLRVLRALGIDPAGGVPGSSGSFAYTGDRLHTLPGGLVSLLSTGCLQLGEKMQVARLLARLPRLDTSALDRRPVREWVEGALAGEAARHLLLGLVRVATYGGDPDQQSAGAALAQLQRALAANVLYVHGGWQTLVEALVERATAAKVELMTGRRVEALTAVGGCQLARLDDGTAVRAGSVLLAGSPGLVRRLLGDRCAPALGHFIDRAQPVVAACLDVALSSLPRPRARFALGLDVPLYASVHSAVAKLAPAGGALLHLARYGGGEAAEAELERLLDLLQPGWRERIVARRFLPRLTVAHALPTAGDGGLAGRPRIDGSGIPGVYLCGDWIGGEGMLADAALASAEAAATALLADAAAATRAAA